MKKITVTKDELLNRYNTMSVNEIAKYYDINTTALYKLLDKAGIPRKVNRRSNSERVIVTLKD